MKNNHLSKILSLLLALCMLFCMIPAMGLTASALDVTYDEDETTILISTAEQLAAIGVDENYPRTGSYKLANDIDLSSYGDWTPLCGGFTFSKDTAFIGKFDGQGHTISGMTVNATGTNVIAGLFCGLTANSSAYAEIKNLILKDCSVNVAATNEFHAGILAGKSDADNYKSAEITNVAILNSSVNGTAQKNNACGIGSVIGYGIWVKLYNIYSDAELSGGCAVANDKFGIGGMIGRTYRGYGWCSYSVFNGTITNNNHADSANRYTNGILALNANQADYATQVDYCLNNYYNSDKLTVTETDTEETVGTNGGHINGTALTAKELEEKGLTELGLSGDYWCADAGSLVLRMTLSDTVPHYDGYIPIYDSWDLAKIGKDDNYPLGGSYMLMNDIDMSDYGNWTPIGDTTVAAGQITTQTSFSGIFDGAGHTISNMTISMTRASIYAGLFGTVYEATIQNLVMKNASVTAAPNDTGAGKRTYAGVVVGTSKTSASSIYNYMKNVAVYDSAVTATTYRTDNPVVAGGLWGFAENYVQFENCYADVDVTAICEPTNDTDAQSYQTAAGGIIGATWSGTAKAIDCIFAGTLTDVTYGSEFDTTALEKTYVHKNSIVGAKMSGWDKAGNSAGSVSQTDCYYLDTVDVNLDNTSGLDGTAISAEELAEATAETLGFDAFYWVNDGKGLYLAVAPVATNDDGAIEIDTAEELANIGVYSLYPLTGDYVLTADIDLSSYENWTPLCGGHTDWTIDKTKAFNGVLDGQGHTISGMNVEISGSKVRAGLFAAMTSNSTKTTYIKNIVFKDCTVDATGTQCVDAGIIVGATDTDNNISVVVSNVAIIDSSVNGVANAANACGVGSVAGQGTRVQLYDVYSNADISGGCTVENGQFGMAGMVGRAYRGYAWAKRALFDGTVTNSTSAPEDNPYVYANAIFALNGNQSNASYATNTTSCTEIYYNSDKLTPSTATNGGSYDGTALSNYDLGITTVGAKGLDPTVWMHNGYTPILKIVGDKAYTAGDVTRDGKSNILDLIRMKKYIASATNDMCLVAGDLNRDLEITATDLSYIKKSLLGISNATTAVIYDSADSIKYLGNANPENNILAMNWTDSGFAFNVNAEGDITATLNGDVGSYPYAKLAVTVDGTTQIIKVYEGINTYTLASNLEYGKHTVEVLKITEYSKGKIYAIDISFMGSFDEKPADAELTINFYGDSITAGEGVLAYSSTSPTGADYVDCQFGNLTYAAKTAEALGADMSVWAKSGIKTKDAVSGLGLNAEGSLSADVVVINLGTNDWSVISEESGAITEAGTTAEKAAITAMLDAVAAKYGNDVKIVWCYGSMGDSHSYESIIKGAVEAYAANNANVYYCSLLEAANNAGGSGHPTEAGHTAAAEILADFIENTVLAAE